MSDAGAVAGLDLARRELRERQGSGARWDAENAPHEHLALARSGTAYFARQLGGLRDDELDAPSLRPGWTRRRLIAHLGYHTRALALLVEEVRAGVAMPRLDPPGPESDEISLGATLPAPALRYLIDHAAIHLSVEWRDLRDEEWDAGVVDESGRAIPLRETAWRRAVEAWTRAVDLDSGGSFLDFPPELVDGILHDAVGTALRDGAALTLRTTDRDGAAAVIEIGSGAPVVSGRAADLARWLTGRGARRLSTATGARVPALPGGE